MSGFGPAQGTGGADAELTAIGALTPTDSNVIVGNGTTWVAESGATARTSLGLGTGDTATFTAVVAPSLDRSDAGALAIGGTNATSVVVRGAATFDSNGRLTLPNGTSGTPSIVGSDADSGLYLDGTTTRIYSNNADKLAVGATGTTHNQQFNNAGNLLSAFRLNVSARTGDASIGATSTANVETNAGAAGEVILTLPTAVAGQNFYFVVDAAQFLRVKANTGDVIRGDLGTGGTGTISTSASAGYWRSNEVGASLKVVAVDTTTWQVISIGGTWTVDS